MNNKKIRLAAFERGIKYYEIAAALNISPYTLSHQMKVELSKEKTAEILNVIDRLSLRANRR